MSCYSSYFQGELEHRTPKARYLRTDRKDFVGQLTQIERREARIRRISVQNFGRDEVHDRTEKVSTDPGVHYCIGKSERFFDHLGTFVRQHNGDPAIKVAEYATVQVESVANDLVIRTSSPN